MEPKDIIWRVMERLTEQQNLLIDSTRELHPKFNSDLIEALRECERLTKTQINILSRMSKRYQ